MEEEEAAAKKTAEAEEKEAATKKKAEEEAKKAAEEEAEKKAEEQAAAKKKAEEEAKTKAEEEAVAAKKKTEEEAKKAAEEEAKKKAEEQACPKSPKASGGNDTLIDSEISSDFDSGVLSLGTPQSVTAVSTPSTSPTKSPKVSVGNGMRERAEWFIDKQRMNVGRSVGTTRRRVALLLGGGRALKS